MMLWPAATQAKNYCDGLNKQNIYEEVYCKIQPDDNPLADEEVIKKISLQLGYDEGLTALMIEKGQSLSCDNIETYANENNLALSSLGEDVKRACVGEDSESLKADLEAFSRMLNRLEEAYNKEQHLNMNKERLKQTFQASEIYWDGQISAAIPFDVMVDLNLMDDMLFGSQAQWVNDSFGFSKMQDKNDQPVLNPLAPVPPGQEQAQQQVQNQEQEQQAAAQENFIHPDCFNVGMQQESALCGNGVVDGLFGEACDDGNKVEGDGCSNICQITPGNLQCKDPNAVTLQPFSELPLGQNNTPLCPPEVLEEINDLAEDGPDQVEALNQEPVPEPVPFTGGTLSPLPVSNTPSCPAGQELVQVSAGTKQVSTCIPSGFCGDFNAIREALFGQNWQESENADIAAAIETAVCVNFTTGNRPNTPYAMNEGCIDCHFRAMADSLQKALESNVTPLANTTSAFALSNPWGPSFSLDLNIGVKRVPKLKAKPSNNASEEEGEEDEEPSADEGSATHSIDEADKNNKSGESSVSDDLSSTDLLNAQVNSLNERVDAISENLGVYQSTSNAISDVAFSNEVITQIGYLTGAFGEIQSNLITMANTAEALSTKKVCEL